MSDWLERQLARELAPVTAPGTLKVRLGFAPPKRREFPRAWLAVAAAVVLVLGGGYAASRIAALDLRQSAARQLRSVETVESASPDRVVSAAWLHREGGVDPPQPPASAALRTRSGLVRCAGGAALPLQVDTARATVLLAHAGPAPVLAATPDSGCRLCHSL